MNSAIGVMWHRQVKEFFRNKQRLIVMSVQPLLFLVAFGFGIGGSVGEISGVSYIQYLLPGIVTTTIMMSSMMGGIWDKKFGFLKETLVAPVSRTSLLFGRCLGGATTSVFQGLIVFGLGHFMGFRILSWSIFPVALVAMFAIALLFNLFGTTLASKFDDMQSFPSVMNLLMMPMMFISGAFFATSSFPGVLQWLIRVNPLNYSVNIMRFVLSGIENSLSLSVGVLGLFILGFGVVGTWAFGRIEA
jgi:ABC-2 type transport system permease protein